MEEYTDALQSGKSNVMVDSLTQASVDRLGNFRQKDSGALIFSSAGTLNRWMSIQMMWIVRIILQECQGSS